MTRWFWSGLFLVTVAAFALRWPQLDLRPMHCDEAVHALKFQKLWERGSYRYDPNEYHGPMLCYATRPVVALSSARDFGSLPERTLRMVPLLFGLGLILLLGLLGDALGRGGALCAGVLTAASPALVFYSRYYIHEQILVFFTMLLLVGIWRYAQRPHIGWALLSGASLGLMHATKETFVLAVAALTAAGVVIWVWNRRAGGADPASSWKANYPHLLWGLVAAVVVSVLFFSSFFTNPIGPVDSIRTYLPWLHRAGGHSPHLHPWHFYLERLFFFHHGAGPYWSEGLILVLAVIGGGAALTRKGLPGASTWFVRFLVFYTLTLTVTYTLISYKTPWCALGFLHGMILLAGVGAMVLVAAAKCLWMRIGVAVLLLVAAAQLALQAWRASFVFFEDRRNPYVYAQTVSDILDLVDTVETLAVEGAGGYRMPVAVAAPGHDYWPLPWYLRRFRSVGYYDRVDTNQVADVLIVSPKLKAAVTGVFGKTHDAVGLFGLRPTTYLQLYVRSDLWRDYQQKLRSRAAQAE